jgi:hypothetical protein
MRRCRGLKFASAEWILKNQNNICNPVEVCKYETE